MAYKSRTGKGVNDKFGETALEAESMDSERRWTRYVRPPQ